MSQVTHPAETHSGTVTSWLPVTTAYISSEQCSSTFIMHLNGNGMYGFDINVGLYVDKNLRCLPQEATAWWDQKALGLSGTTTLLGPFTCPSAYTTAALSAVDDSTTLVACCPSDYDFHGIQSAGTAAQCISSMSANQVFTSASEISDQSFTLAEGSFSVSTTVMGLQVNGYIFASTPTSTSGSATATKTSETTTSTSISTATFIPSNTQNANSISTGAVAGIAIAAAIGGCLLSMLAAWLLMRHRRNKQGEPLMMYGDGMKMVPTGELDNSYVRHELPGVVMAHELNGNKGVSSQY